MEAVLMTAHKLDLADITDGSEYWIGDTGATIHMTNSNEGMTDLRQTDDQKVVMGNGTEMIKEQKGTLKGWLVNTNGQVTYPISIGSVMVSKKAKFNIISLTLLMKQGWQLIGNQNGVTLKKNGQLLNFDHTVKTDKGTLYVIRIKRNLSLEIANPGVEDSANE